MARSQPAAAAAADRRTGHPAALETQLLRDCRTRPAARAAGTAHSAVSVTDQNGWNGVTANGAQCSATVSIQLQLQLHRRQVFTMHIAICTVMLLLPFHCYNKTMRNGRPSFFLGYLRYTLIVTHALQNYTIKNL